MAEEWTLIDCLHGWEDVPVPAASGSPEDVRVAANEAARLSIPETERTFDGPGLAEWSTDDAVPCEVRVKVVRADAAQDRVNELGREKMRLLNRAERAEAALRGIVAVPWPTGDWGKNQQAAWDAASKVVSIARAALPDEGDA